MGMQKAMAVLRAKTGAASNLAANGLIYQQFMKEAMLLSFNDAFYFSMIIMICILPLVFLLKRPIHPELDVMGH